MFLKSLTMKGFKSFADSTVLEFEPGVTVVVGPNGSGKSNVVDAVAWVLGAQGPSTVRSGKMEDVVFAGTPDRPALGRAEVSLVIDNSSKSLPIEFTEVTVTRTLYRSGDSEYSLNGVPCRLLDIQELLSDAGVGRQQHVIVAQGQIDQVLNSRPEDRRAIVEEAAGVLKFRRRKERAERRLAATETNLTRLQDLQREVRRQLRPLEKQADAARRHGAVVNELRSIRLFLTGEEIRALRTAQITADASSKQMTSDLTQLRADLGGLDVQITASESQLASAGDSGADLLPRVESMRERCRGLIALIDERSRAVENDRGSILAADVALTLQNEAERLSGDLGGLASRAESVREQLETLGAAEKELSSEAESLEIDRPLVGMEAGKRAAEVRGELGPLKRGLERLRSDSDALGRRSERLAEAVVEANQRLEQLQSKLSDASAAEAALVQNVDEAQRKAELTHSDLDAALAELEAAEREKQTWRTRHEALELALEVARESSGFEQLKNISGVIGVLGELIEIEAGWESAVNAALGSSLASVVVEDVQSARAALESLRASDVSGSILAMGIRQTALELPEAGVSLRQRVSSLESDISPLLDSLLTNAVCVSGGWKEAVDLAIERPGLTVVTQDGDCCGPDGWSVRLDQKASTLAALEEAEQSVQIAEARLHAAELEVETAEAANKEAQASLEEAIPKLESNDDALTRSSDGIEKAQRQRSDLISEKETLQARIQGVNEALAKDFPRVAELEEQLQELDSAESLERSAATDAHTKRRDLESRIRAAAQTRAELEANQKSIQEQEDRINERLSAVDQQLRQNVESAAGQSDRLLILDEMKSALKLLRDRLEVRLSTLETEVRRLREKREQLSAEVRSVADRLEGLRSRRSELEKGLAELQEQIAANELADTERRFKVDSLTEMLRIELNADSEDALSASEPPLEESVTPAMRARELESDLRRMGPINPLALQEYESLKERHDFVAEQLDDVRSGRKELNKVIANVDAEIVDVFSSAFQDVAENYRQIFSTLFPGGEGKLTLTEPEKMLETGIELEAKPSGKNVRKLSLLSGGERSLTALAFLFAIFRSRPSPFYVMDEVEAALDDINLHRFLGLVSEFRNEAQLLIVSHQKRTMESADVLYGVTMAPGGSSQVLSEKVAS